MNTYKVIDTTLNKVIGEGLVHKELGQLLGVNGISASRYAITKTLLNDRYKIEVDGTLGGNKYNFPPKLLNEWNEVHEAAKLLKSGKGKMVTKIIEGKVIKCVEIR